MGSTARRTPPAPRTRGARPRPARRTAEPPRVPLDPEAELADALALLPEVVAETAPAIPVPAAIAEAEELAAAAARSSARLLRVPFDHDLLATLPARIEGLRRAEAAWRAVRARRTPRPLAKLRAEAAELKRDLLAGARYLLRDDEAARGELRTFGETDSLAGLVDDLLALSAFVRRHAEGLATLEHPLGPDGAAARAGELARALAREASNEHVDEAAAEALADRNRLFHLLEEAVREVRAAGAYALRKEPEALAAFRGEGWSRRKLPREPRFLHLALTD